MLDVSQRTNIYDLGRVAGVSRTVVSLVVNGQADKHGIAVKRALSGASSIRLRADASARHARLRGGFRGLSLARSGLTVSYDPAYRKLAYPGVDVPLDTGVCCDVVVRALRKQGLDLQKQEVLRGHARGGSTNTRLTT